MTHNRIKVLIIDDSALIRKILSEAISKDPDLIVVGTASDPYKARDEILRLKPDVLTLDLVMPKMDGLTFLRKLLPQYPIPVIVVSSLSEKGAQITLDALEAGAIDFVTKPSKSLKTNLESMIETLKKKIKIASKSRVATGHISQPTKTESFASSSKIERSVIAIGGSTGGPNALQTILEQLPANSPGIIMALHMPTPFTKLFSDRLNRSCKITVKEAKNGDRVLPGKALLAPGDTHMEIFGRNGNYFVRITNGKKIDGHRPNINLLFQSCAKAVGKHAVGIILTGMGSDGAAGLNKLKHTGATTFGQDEKTCVVFGMPRAATKMGAVKKLVPLNHLPYEILAALK